MDAQVELESLYGGVNTLLDQVNLHTRLFNNVLLDISEKDAANRISNEVNHLLWLSGSMVSVRYLMSNLLGKFLMEPFPELFSNNKAIQDNVDYPSLNEQIKEWEIISKRLKEYLVDSSKEGLLQESIIKFPMSGNTVFHALTFLVHREAYVLGQMGLLRKAYGYEAMKY